MKLTIVIPAYNEEEAIASTIERTLASRTDIVQGSPVDDVEIIVVSDGSTDRTPSIASGYEAVRVIVFERNRGYGAAIKRGFEEATGELVGFLDADGTCDPAFFSTLCRSLIENDAHVALGSRMGPDSRMPRVRRLGNRIYALILSTLSNRVVTDTASGMRVIRRDVLSRLYPLPDGLHFTPAMSARVLMDPRLTIVEQPMPYEERVGRSKLNVLTDGVRFLRTIFEMTLMWRPARLFAGAAVVLLVAMMLLALYPLESWWRNGGLSPGAVDRLLLCSMLGGVGVVLLSAGVMSEQVRTLLDDRPRPPSFIWALLNRVYSRVGLLLVSVAVWPLLLGLIGTGAWRWFTTGHVGAGWPRVMLAGLLFTVWGYMVLTALIGALLRFHVARKSIWDSPCPADLLRTATKPRRAADRLPATTARRPSASAGAVVAALEDGARIEVP